MLPGADKAPGYHERLAILHAGVLATSSIDSQ